MSPDDLDLLADYSAGVLDDISAAEVTRLIEANPTWQRTYAALVEADDVVRAELRGAATARLEPMPADVIAQLDRAFAAVDAVDSRPRTDHAAASGAVASLDQARSRRRVPRLHRLALAAAAAVIAVVGGISVTSQLSTGGLTTSTDRGQPAAEAEPGLAPTGSNTDGYTNAVTFLSTGNDYRASTLAQLGRLAAAPPAAPATPRGQVPEDSLEEVRKDVTGELARLTNPTDLAACLAMIRSAHAGQPAAVDYARYDGSPALVVLLRHTSSTIVVAVGPECGLTDLSQRAVAVVS